MKKIFDILINIDIWVYRVSVLINFVIGFFMVFFWFRIKKNFSEMELQAQLEEKRSSEIKELLFKLEHHNKLVAIGELANGIAHEFGQPITNIRYTVQFHRKMLEKKAISKEEVFEIFDSILEETERMGRINKRLSPITSSRNVIEKFDLIDRIQKRVKAENIRLNESKIDVNISPLTPVYITGDSVKYDQIISNLLLNAIDAIQERQNSQINRIDIHIEDTIKEIKMIFTDTGIGIHLKDKNKIFSPFFTTKPPGKGEGLGLFIVWNLLKMYGGSIEIDNSYNDGARFLISIPKQTDNQKEA